MFNSLNPPPLAPLIPGSILLKDVVVSSSEYDSQWPTRAYPSVITESTLVDMTYETYNYFYLDSPNNITLTLKLVPIGTMIIVEIHNSGNVTIVMDNITPSSILPAGTYIVAKFSDNVKSTQLTNPSV